jgi:hypothetical protein
MLTYADVCYTEHQINAVVRVVKAFDDILETPILHEFKGGDI